MILEAGNLLIQQINIPPEELPDRQKIARGQIGIGNTLGYQVYNVGGNDFSLGRAFLIELQKYARYPFISANIIDSASARLLFKPYVILNAGKRKFGVVGVTSPFKYPVNGLRFDDPVTVLQRTLPKIRKQVDYVIVLAAVNTNDEQKLLDANLEVDFILIAGQYRYQQNLEKVNKALVGRVGTLGKYVGIITIEINDPRRPLDDLSSIRTQLEFITTRLKSYRQHAGGQSLEKFYKDQPAIYKVVQDLQHLQEELQQRQAAVVNPVDFKLFALDDKVPDDPNVREQVNKLHKSLSKVTISDH